MENEYNCEHIESINPYNNRISEGGSIDTKHELLKIIPREQLINVFKSPFCELDEDYLGSTSQYKEILNFVPKDKIIIDLGCGEAAQSFYFKDYKKYIGVDILPMSRNDSIKNPKDTRGMWLDRFYTQNTTHYVCKAKDFLDFEFNKLNINTNDCFVIMCLIPDSQSMINALDKFPNIKIYFPGIGFDFLRYDGKIIRDNNSWERIKGVN